MNKLNKYFPRRLQSKHVINLILFRLLNSTNDFWLIDSNFVGVMRFYKDQDNSDKSIEYMFIEEARFLWQKSLNEGWQKTNKKW